MSLHGLALFCLAYIIATSTPGPGIAALVARVLSRGPVGLPAFIAGYVVGDLIWLTFAATGMAVLAQTAHTLFMLVKYGGALYLLYLAYRMWVVPAQSLSEQVDFEDDRSPPHLFGLAVAMTLGNPKVMVFFLALLPTVVDVQGIALVAFAQIAGSMCIILSSVLVIYALAAMRARSLFRNARAVRWLNRGSGTVMWRGQLLSSPLTSS